MNNIKQLIEELNYYTKKYDEGNPVISDREYDEKFFQLRELEKETGIIFPNSPTQSISYEVVNALTKVKHNHKMLSLDKTKDISDVLKFIAGQSVLAMCKMDGLTCALHYKNGKLVGAETRGNGLIGEDILHNIKVMPSVPVEIPYLGDLDIDGEVICTYKDFESFSQEYKNPRNFAAGSIRLLESKESAARNLTFVAWEVITPMYYICDPSYEMLLQEKLDYLDTLGFITVPYVNNIEKIEEVIETLTSKAKELSYPIDGIVFKYADCAYGRSLGETSHHFNNAIAYKFYDETYATILRDIEWSMGRTGILTPVAIFDAIDIDGSTVSRASLHNLSIMYNTLQCLPSNSGLTPISSQIVNVMKSNMIIPQIESSEMPKDGEEWNFLLIPTICPICGQPLVVRQDNETQVLYCQNDSCEGKFLNKIEHFCSKKGLDIKGVSKATLEKLIEWGWIERISDIFTLSDYRSEWIQKPGFGIKSVDKILESIKASSVCNLSQFIAALGIPLIGVSAAKELENHFNSWNNFIAAVRSGYQFYNIPNFGIEMNNAIISFDYDEAEKIVDFFIKFNTPNSEELTIEKQKLNGKVFVITGKLQHFKNREELTDLITSLGGKVTGSVSRNTNYLINNDINSTSSKNKTAQNLNIPILTEENFCQIFGINS